MITAIQARRGVSLLTLIAAAGLGLAACQPGPANTAATNTTAAPAPLSAIPLAESNVAIAPAPTAAALPPAPPAPVGRLANPGDRYAFAERAYAVTTAFGDAPPDYTFDYGGGERPWVWRGDDNSMRVAELLPGGGYRYYYYEPGAQTPYLVRDADYSYGYDGGQLVVVYDSRGHVLAPNALSGHAEIAGRVFARGQALFQASQRQQREAVAEANWVARRAAIADAQSQWAADQAADDAWRAYHAQQAEAEQAQWSAERYRRESEAERFAQSINDQRLADQERQAVEQARQQAAIAPPRPSAGPGPGPGIFPGGPPHHGPPGPPPAPAFAAPPAGPAHNPPPTPHNGPPPNGPPPNGTPHGHDADALRAAQIHQQAVAAAAGQRQAQIAAGRRAAAQSQAQSQAAQADAARRSQLLAQHPAPRPSPAGPRPPPRIAHPTAPPGSPPPAKIAHPAALHGSPPPAKIAHPTPPPGSPAPHKGEHREGHPPPTNGVAH